MRDHCHYTGNYRGAAHNSCNLLYKIPREIPAVFRNRSTYDYHFIIEELAKEFKSKIDSLGENTEKYITFSVPIETENDNSKTIKYKIKFIDSYRFMHSSPSSLVDNLSEINNKKPKDEFIDNFRTMLTSLSHSVDKISEINKKLEKSENKITDNLRSISSSLSYNVDNLSMINKKIEKSENNFIDSFRSMSSLLLSLVNDLSVINNKKNTIRK